MEPPHSDLLKIIDKSLPALKRDYQRGLNLDLSRHRWQGILERQLLALEEAWLMCCSQHIQAHAIVQASPALTVARDVVGQLVIMKDDLVAWALHYNGSSCALSSFGEEHAPGPAYLEQILFQVEIRWQQWCRESGLASLPTATAWRAPAPC